MNKQQLVIAVVIFLLFFFILVSVLSSRFKRKKRHLHIHDIAAATYTAKGRIGPSNVYENQVTFNVKANGEFENGGLMVLPLYPNSAENGVNRGLHLLDIPSGNNVITGPAPCAVTWNVVGGPNSSTCTTSSNVEGWEVQVIAVSHWDEVPVRSYSTLDETNERNTYEIVTDHVPCGPDGYYVASMTLTGLSYDVNNVAVPTSLSFGAIVSDHRHLTVLTAGSDYFTAGPPQVTSVRVVKVENCDVVYTGTLCLGRQV